MLKEMIPEKWLPYIMENVPEETLQKLDTFITKEYEEQTIYPEKEDIFRALKAVSPNEVKVVIIGQDPYHEPNQAHGLSFSVKDGVPHPKSLINIFKEMESDLGFKPPQSGNLSEWAEQGVLLLNTVLTVRKGQANSHKEKGWEEITTAVLKAVLEQPQPKVFILWGNQAQDLFFNIYNRQPNVMFIKSAHPSPLSAYRGFFGSHPFSKTNTYLSNRGVQPIDWMLLP